MYNFLQMYFIVSIQWADENALTVSCIFVSDIIVFNYHRCIFSIEIANVKDYPIIFDVICRENKSVILSFNFVMFTFNAILFFTINV